MYVLDLVEKATKDLNIDDNFIDFQGDAAAPDGIDDLLLALSDEELAELSVIDPDVSLHTMTSRPPNLHVMIQDSSVPPSLRCLYHCDKKPSQRVNRPQLIQCLRDNALNAPIKQDVVPYIPGIKRGKPV